MSGGGKGGKSTTEVKIPEWLEAATWGLAARLATYHHLPMDIANDIRQQAEQKKAEMLAFDQEITGFQVVPYYMGNRS